MKLLSKYDMLRQVKKSYLIIIGSSAHNKGENKQSEDTWWHLMNWYTNLNTKYCWLFQFQGTLFSDIFSFDEQWVSSGTSVVLPRPSFKAGGDEQDATVS